MVWLLASAFLLVMIVSTQERHRAPLLALDAVFAAEALRGPWSLDERRFVPRARRVVTAALVALNVVARFAL